MRLASVIIILHVSLLLLSCKKGDECSTCPPPTDNFFLRIIVKDASGNAIPGLRVSAWNNLSIKTSQTNLSLAKRVAATRFSHNMMSTTTDTFRLRPNYPNPFNNTTTIGFQLLVPSIVTMKVYDLLGQEIALLVNNETFDEGFQELEFSATAFLTGVYKVRFFAKSIVDPVSSIAPLRDSIFVFLNKAPDAEQTIIGYTSPEGVYETTNDLLFPSLFNPPPLIHTSENGPDSLEVFTVRDTVTIVLTDTLSHRYRTFQKSIRRGANEFRLTLSGFRAPITPDIVLDNLKSALGEYNVEDYMRCFFDTTVRPYEFFASEGVRSNYPVLFDQWDLKNERQYFLNLGQPVNGTPLLTFTNLQTMATSDSVEYQMNYTVYFPHHGINIPQIAKGALKLTLGVSSEHLWSIYRWQDFKTTSDTTWSLWKAVFQDVK